MVTVPPPNVPKTAILNELPSTYEFINCTNRHYPTERSAEKIQHKLIFDGKKLIDQQYKDSKLVRSVAYPATSGVIGSTDPKQKNRGPIPEGKYYLNTKDISHNPLRAVTNHFLGDWGLYRVPLHPDPKTGEFYLNISPAGIPGIC